MKAEDAEMESTLNTLKAISLPLTYVVCNLKNLSDKDLVMQESNLLVLR